MMSAIIHRIRNFNNTKESTLPPNLKEADNGIGLFAAANIEDSQENVNSTVNRTNRSDSFYTQQPLVLPKRDIGNTNLASVPEVNQKALFLGNVKTSNTVGSVGDTLEAFHKIIENHTFGFPNDFKHTNDPLSLKLVSDLVEVPVKGTNSNDGLCGGLAAAAIMCYLYNLHISKDIKEAPGPQKYPELFEYLKDCQLATLTVEAVSKYFRYMFNDKNENIEIMKKEWPKIKADIDKGQPCLLGLIRAKANFWQNPSSWKLDSSSWKGIIQNHQVAVFGYKMESENIVRLYIYDPKYDPKVVEPYNKNASIILNLEDGTMTYSDNVEDNNNRAPLYTLFKVNLNFFKFPQPPEEIKEIFTKVLP